MLTRFPGLRSGVDHEPVLRQDLPTALLDVAALGRFVATSSMLLPRRLATACRPLAALHSDAGDGYPASPHGLLAHLCDHALNHTEFQSGDEHVDCVARVHIQRLGDDGRVLAEHFADDEVFEFSLPGNEGLRRYRCTVHTWRPAVGDGFVLLRVVRHPQGGWGAGEL